MDENEYLLQYLIRERLREAEAHGTFQSVLRQARQEREARRVEALAGTWQWLGLRTFLFPS